MMLKVNANTMAYYSVAGMAIAMVLQKRERGIKRIILCAGMIFLAVAGILTVSRSWMVAAIIFLLLVIFEETKSVKSVLIGVTIGSVLALAAYFWIVNTPEILTGYLTRWSNSSAQTGGGRFILFAEYMKAFVKNPRYLLTGTGVTQYRMVIGAKNAIHNGCQQIIVCYGVLGTFVFLYSIIKPFRYVKYKKDILYWMPFIIVILFVQTIQFVNPEILMLPYAIAYMVLRLGEIDHEEI